MVDTQLKNFQLISKPSGAICNLDCEYCFYLEKSKLYPQRKQQWKMTEEVLEEYIKANIEQQPANVIDFIWQGGEPTLLGLEYYQNAIFLQKRYAKNKKINNFFQTNGLNLDETWARFFKKNNFLVGISIDGPKEFNDVYRVTRSGKGTLSKVLNAIKLLNEHQVEFNTLTVVNQQNVNYPLKIYEFLKSIDSRYIQFIPVVERKTTETNANNLTLIAPEYRGQANVTEWSVKGSDYGKFLNTIFDYWYENDIGKYFIINFEQTMSQSLGLPSSCITSESCGTNLVIEANGDLYSCDHFVYPQYLIGNLLNDNVQTMLTSENHLHFTELKKNNISQDCLVCEFKPLCHGGCPKHRFLIDSKGHPRRNYHCDSYKVYFAHVMPKMQKILKQMQLV